jgi:hypothetical protein
LEKNGISGNPKKRNIKTEKGVLKIFHPGERKKPPSRCCCSFLTAEPCRAASFAELLLVLLLALLLHHFSLFCSLFYSVFSIQRFPFSSFFSSLLNYTAPAPFILGAE